MKLTEKDITGPVAKELRERAGLSQAAFWNPVGVQQSVACRYEQGGRVPKAVRILIVARYVSGVVIDASTHTSVADLARLGEIQSKAIDAKSVARTASAEIGKAVKSLTDAQTALSNV